MEKSCLCYEGKAKKVFASDNEEVYIVQYKDDATAFNGIKKGIIENKGIINNRMSNHIFKALESQGIKTHYIKELNDRETAVRKVDIIPVEVIIRNVAAGSFAKRYGIEEGRSLICPTLEYSYKNDDLGDPLTNEYHLISLGITTKAELTAISKLAFKINDILSEFFKGMDIMLVDFKLEFGRCTALGGEIILADEISPDTCRLWDIQTGKRLDKDRFRRDMGDVEEGYIEILQRLGLEISKG